MCCNVVVDHRRADTVSSRKNERLINLTIALLATKRFLTKSEIFRTIEGYDGNTESKERMFERDKDDLRTMGIEIEVGGLDPLFDDEAGYRIRPDAYALNLGEISGEEVALLSLAAESWRGAAMGDAAQSALNKLLSLGISSDFETIPAMAPKMLVNSPNFLPIIRALTDLRSLSFEYLSKDLTVENREIDPYGLANSHGAWYLVGHDHARDAVRVFRLDRIHSEVTQTGKPEAFTLPEGFDVQKILNAQLFDSTMMAQLRVRQGKGYTLIAGSRMISNDDDFVLYEVGYSNRQKFIDSILWHADDVIVESPADLRAEVISRLQLLVETHV